MFKTKREKTLLWVLLIAVFAFTLSNFYKNSTLFVYHHMKTKTAVFPNIAPVLKELNKTLETSKSYLAQNNIHVKYLYQNAYGSGFLKHNPIPNDLDCSVGVYLGKYKWDGKNDNEIASEILSDVAVFHTAFYEALQNHNSANLFSAKGPMETMGMLSNTKNKENESFKIALKHIFKDDTYILPTKKAPLDKPEMKILSPFVLKGNEILIEDLAPVETYSEIVQYSPQMKPALREVSVVFDFFADIENTQTHEVKRIELVPESFLGERLQLSRRLFTPSVFVNIDSYNYLNSMTYLKDDEAYLSNRIYNLKRHVQLVQNHLDIYNMPVKMLKRFHQSLDAFGPVLSDEEQKEYYGIIDKYLKNNDLALINEIQTLTKNYYQIALSPVSFKFFKQNGGTKKLFDVLKEDTENLKKSKTVDKKYSTALEKSVNEIIKRNSQVNSDESLIKFNDFLFAELAKNYLIYNKISQPIINKNELLKIDDSLKKAFTNAGFKQFDIYWLEADTIGIIKDEQTKNLTPELLKQIAKENDLPDANYVLITKEQSKAKIYVRNPVWARFNTTDEQDKNFEKMKNALMQDKNNFKPKTKLILKLSP